MTDLASFLLERLSEEEFVARAAGGNRWAMMADLDEVAVFAERKPGDETPDGKGWEGVAWWIAENRETVHGGVDSLTDYVPFADHIARHNPARVLADIEAKRSLIDYAYMNAACIDSEWGDCCTAEQLRERGSGGTTCYGPAAVHQVLARIALPYANHEDYQPEWKP